MTEAKMPLDELELCIQLVLRNDPELNNATYKQLAEVIEIEFDKKVDLQDVILLHEPKIEDDREDLEIMFSSMFNYTSLRGIY